VVTRNFWVYPDAERPAKAGLFHRVSSVPVVLQAVLLVALLFRPVLLAVVAVQPCLWSRRLYRRNSRGSELQRSG
jgi:hypothetical protein